MIRLSWRDRPTIITEWPEEIDTIMAIDENGTNDLKGLLRLKDKYFFKFLTDNISDIKIDQGMRWFTITGVAMERNNFPSFKENIMSIKTNYWYNGLYQYKGVDKRVVFHSREIRKSEGPFNPKLINYAGFIADLTRLMRETPYTIYSSTIDKVKHIQKYSSPFPIYNLSLDFIVERYCIELSREGKSGALLLESRGRKEDFKILRHLSKLLSEGNKYNDASHFECIKKVYFNPKWCYFNDYHKSFIQLELADLASYPIHKFNTTGTKDQAFETIENKIYNYPHFTGYGIKVFPK